ncbi:NADH-quinone oxidoreductase subunit C [candidate division TA06 bacterium]|uniref:NADH-quinone oxidoreductase n=1 Tax=candidate division TA06 bacterium TaxID=2250710 RepID=A0A933IB07_UNCT6|nr:NADH-quinone oxidoreductase subunit C [candidate division TA06 bacterium]
MTAEEIKKILEDGLGSKIKELTTPAPRRMFLWVDKDNLAEACRTAKEEAGFYHISTITARDTGDKLEALYHLAQSGMVLTVRAQTDRQHPLFPTVIPVYPGAVFYEREVHDLMGIGIEGHPDLRPLVLPEDWPSNVFPLRKDWQYNREKGAIE